jgi:hypothetical protein
MELEIRRNSISLALFLSFAKYKSWKSGLILSLSHSEARGRGLQQQPEKESTRAKAKRLEASRTPKGRQASLLLLFSRRLFFIFLAIYSQK